MTTRLDLTDVRCADCTMLFAVPSDFQSIRRTDGKTFFCPAGHQNYYSAREDELKQLRKERQSLESQLKWSVMEAEQAKREKTTLKGQLTKTRNRLANGVCPCCHRTFKQLAAHMNNKHPDFKRAVLTTPPEGEKGNV